MKKFGYVQNDKAEMQSLQNYLASKFEMKSLDVGGYTNADWTGLVTNRRSTFGYFTFISGNLVTWRSKK
ncbi:unnamed protein product [Prunus brigantina]